MGMNDTSREQTLHKIVAASAFLFSLCILPVAQYFLVTKQLPTSTEAGTVAGASTDQTITAASVAPPLTCVEQAKQLADLDAWVKGQQLASRRQSDAKVKPYQDSIGKLQGSPESIATEKQALTFLITTERKPFTDHLAQAEAAAESQKNELASKSCVSE
jgi:hypothetical protein